MFKAKYQAHRLVNIIFYIIVFFIGFYMGVMGQKVGIKSLFDKFLMIDNVKAFDIVNDNGIVIDETFIAEKTREAFPDFNFGTYNKYIVSYYYGYPNLGKWIQVYIFTSQGADDLRVYTRYNSGASAWYPLYSTSNQTIYKFTYNIDNNSVGNNSIVNVTLNDSDSLNVSLHALSSTTTVDYSNFNVNGIDTYETGFNTHMNKLFFSDNYYSSNLDLFANNNDFKQVCVNPIKPFTISTTESEYSNPSDFIWFPYQIIQLNSGLYYTLNRNFVWNDETKHVFFNSNNVIDDYFINGVGLQMQPWVVSSNLTYLYPYSNRYNYYGWNAYPFSITDINTENPILPIFKFSDDFITLQLSSFGIAHGGMTRTHYDLTDENNQNLSMCFYINKMYDVYSLDIDENGNFYGNVDTSNGSIDVYSDNQYNYFTMIDDNLFGFTSILTAPLTAIRQISNGTCSPVSIPILGKTITLPCGDTIFWGREDVQDFKLFWNMFFGGVICYGLGISTFKRIQKFKDPNSDKIEVIDL